MDLINDGTQWNITSMVRSFSLTTSKTLEDSFSCEIFNASFQIQTKILIEVGHYSLPNFHHWISPEKSSRNYYNKGESDPVAASLFQEESIFIFSFQFGKNVLVKMRCLTHFYSQIVLKLKFGVTKKKKKNPVSFWNRLKTCWFKSNQNV